MKRKFHQNTAKGGGRGGSSKLLPVMYTLAREMLWRFGHMDGLFEYLGHNGDLEIEYGKVAKVPRAADVNEADVETFTKMLLRFVSADDLLDEIEQMPAIEEGVKEGSA